MAKMLAVTQSGERIVVEWGTLAQYSTVPNVTYKGLTNKTVLVNL